MGKVLISSVISEMARPVFIKIFKTFSLVQYCDFNSEIHDMDLNKWCLVLKVLHFNICDNNKRTQMT